MSTILLAIPLSIILCLAVGHELSVAVAAISAVAGALAMLACACVSIMSVCQMYSKRNPGFPARCFSLWKEFPDLMLAVWEGDEFVWANAAWLCHSGYTEDELKSLGWKAVLASDWRHIAELGDFEGHVHLIAKDGSLLWMKVTRKKDPDTGQVYGMLQDLTQTARSILTKQKGVEDLERWLDISTNIWSTASGKEDPYYLKLLTSSPAWTSRLGWTFDDLFSVPLLLLIHPNDRPLDLIRAAYATGGTIEFEARVRDRGDGDGYQWHWFDWSWTYDMITDQWYMLANEITESVQTRQRLRESETRFRQAMEHASIGMAKVSPSGAWLEVNNSLCQMLGYSREELIFNDSLSLTHPDDLEESVKLARKMADGDLDTYSQRMRYMTKGGASIWVILSVTNAGSSQSSEYFIAQIQNIDASVRHREQMESTLADLRVANADLLKFASIAAHQLRSPPRSISGAAVAIMEDHWDDLAAGSQDFLKGILIDAESMGDIVDGLFQISKIRTSGTVSIEDVNLYEVLDRVKSRRKDKGDGEIIVNSMPLVHTNYILIQEVLYNLVSNGMKFNESEPKKVWIDVTEEEFDWVFVVRDNGIGIDMTYKHKLYGMFERLSLDYPGTGVGLAMIKAAVDKLGGNIQVESVLEVGTTFTFTIPKP